MRSVASAISSYLTARDGIEEREFLWIVARDRATGAPAAVGFWNDLYDVQATVLDGLTGEEVTRTYAGAGSLISIDPIPLTSDLTVRTVRIRLSQVNDAVENAIRGYDARLAHVEIHKGLLDLRSRRLIAPPPAHFVGQVNGAPIATPAAGAQGSITLSAVSQTRELTRTNPAKKGDAYQSGRSGDPFRKYQSTAGLWEVVWGEAKTSVAGQAPATSRSGNKS